jgi:3-hydroxybutyryl-CoA dehydrogenase
VPESRHRLSDPASICDWRVARYAAPEIVERNMREGRIGLTTGKGFLDYEKLDLEAYRADRLKAFVAMLGFLGLTRPPVLPQDGS